MTGASLPPGGASPEMTVAIPTIDRPELLRRAIASVLEQSSESFEVIVSDNASVARVAGIVAAFGDDRIRFQRHERRLTMTENWNSCLEAAKGHYFLLLSDDDALCTDGLRMLRERISQDGVDRSRPGVCYGRSIVVDRDDRVLWRSPGGARHETAAEFLLALFDHRRAIYPCSTLYRTADLRSIGGYSGDQFGSAADLAAAVCVALRHGGVGFADAEVCRYTEHGGNLTAHVELSHWADDIRAIAGLPVRFGGVDARTEPRLRERADAFAAYFVMDVVLRRELRRGAGPIAAWRVADLSRRPIVLGGHYRARARALAKAIYLWVRRPVRQHAP